MIKWWMKFLLAGCIIMHEMHVRQPGFTYSACGPFTTNKEKIPILKNSRFTIYLSKRTR